MRKQSSLVVAALALCTGAACAQPLACPPAGSCIQGVTTWDADHCTALSGGACPQPSTAAVSCDGAFSIELIDFYRNGNFATFEYRVCRLGGRNALSHWEFGLNLDCLETGFTLRDLVVSASINGVPQPFFVGLDPTTQLNGIKFDNLAAFSTGACNTFEVTLDQSVLQGYPNPGGYRVGVGCIISATKAGNADICRSNRPSPGYACIFGPVCEQIVDPQTGCTPGFWKNNGPGLLDTTLVGTIFPCALATNYGGATLRQALDFSGGTGVEGAQRILLRAAVAAYLNAEDNSSSTFLPPPCTNTNFAYISGAQVVAEACTAMLTGNRDVMLAKANTFDIANNSGCHRNAHLQCIE